MLKLYHSMSKQKEALVPSEPPRVKLYVCGVTVYDRCHLGHARTYIVFDVLCRWLRVMGYDVTYVRNITDVDDKIIQRAHALGIPPDQVASRFTQIMHEDFDQLGLLRPSHEPKATDHMEAMVDLIRQLMARDAAYATPQGDVLFRVASYPGYGALSHQDVSSLRQGTRPLQEQAKESPLDFVLWKAAKPGEPAWDSLLGRGRPGWHIECSAMGLAHLGPTLDVHGGGRDLLFPHHENERAQSEAVTGCVFAKHWMHVGFLTVQQEKMSKSLGNFERIGDVLQREHPETLRHVMLSTHYRSPLEYSPVCLAQSREAMGRLHGVWRRVQAMSSSSLPSAASDPALQAHRDRLHAAMCDDLNTPVAMSVLFDMARAMQTDTERMARWGEAFVAWGQQLGLFQTHPDVFFQWGAQDVDPAWVAARIACRDAARAQRDWATSDAIRAELEAKGIVLEDAPDGRCTWRWKR